MKRTRSWWLIFAIFALSACISLPGPGVTGPGADENGTGLPPPAISTAGSQASAVPPTEPSQNLTAVTLTGGIAGIQMNVTEANRLSIFAQAKDLWTHFGLFAWDQIEPQRTDPASYSWAGVDEAALQRISSAGFKPVGIIRLTPEWAQKYPPYACGPISDSALDRYGQFLNQLVSRYSAPPFNIQAWELGNEPDVSRESVQPRRLFGCWGESGDPYFGGGYYAEMLKKAYPWIKAADPEAIVLVGGLLLDCDPTNPPETSPGSGEFKDCTPGKFLEGILANGGGDFFDGVAFHSYDYYLNETGKFANGNWHSSWDTTGPVLIAKTRYIRNLLNESGHPDKVLVNSELALLCGRKGDEPECQAESYQLTKASYIAQANAAALAEGLSINLWYSLEGWRGSGLLNAELQPNVAFNAFRYSAEELNGARFLQEVTTLPGLRGYEFERQGARFWVVWSLDGQARNVSLPELPARIFDVLGMEIPVSQEINVDFSPQYVEWSP